MRFFISGSRGWTKEELLYDVLDFYVGPDDVLVHGACSSGADAYAANWAREHNVQQETYPADWAMGRLAGFQRNTVMAFSSIDRCLAFIRDDSPGATHAVEEARKAGLEPMIWRQETT